MPTYDYKCANCDHTFEEFQSITAQTLKKCPSCGKKKLQRLIGAGAGLIFKGSGFYTTDYRNDSYTNSAKNDTGSPSTSTASSDSSSTSEGKSESKSESKTETKTDSKPAAESSTPKPAPAKESKKKND